MESHSMPLYPQVNHPVQVQSKNDKEMAYQPMAPPTPSPPVAKMSVLGPENTVTVCQFCQSSIKTAVKYTTTTRTHIAAALWCLACCLCCVPYGSDSAKNSDHYCPHCQRYLGTYEK